MVKWETKQYLGRVENATRKAVFSDSCFRVSDSFWPKFSMCLNTMETSYVARYLGIGGLCCQKAFLAMETRECWPIGMPVSLSTRWYLLMAEQTVFTMEKEYFDSNRLPIYLTIRGTGAYWWSIPWLSQNLANWCHPDLYVPLVPFLMWFTRKAKSC